MIDQVDAVRREVIKLNRTAGNVSDMSNDFNISAIDRINMSILGEPYGMQRKEKKGSWKVVTSVSKKEKVKRE